MIRAASEVGPELYGALLRAGFLFGKKTGGRKLKHLGSGIVVDRTQSSKRSAPKSASMPARGSKRARPSSRRPTKRKVRGRKTVKRKAPIRKSTKRKKTKRKVFSTVSLTVGTARRRQVDHVEYGFNGAPALYIPMNSIGPKEDMLKNVAQSILLHYMHRVGDYRANASMQPVNAANITGTQQSTTWSMIRVHFASLAYANDATQWDVYSYSPGDGSLAEQTLTQMSDRLALGLLAQAKAGRSITQVSVYRDVSNPASATEDQCILMDISAGRNVLEFTCKSAIKMQNATPADVTHSDAQTCGHDNALNINRNPLDGQVFKFRNQVPKFKMQYLISKTDADRQVLSGLSSCYSTHNAGIQQLNMTNYGGEWSIPPPAPSTIFTNYSGKTGISIAPGSHSTQTMFEAYKGPLNSFFERYFPGRKDASTGHQSDVPPGGSCIMVCLKPKYRNDSNVDIKVHAEVDHTYACRVSRAKLTPLPMDTILP